MSGARWALLALVLAGLRWWLADGAPWAVHPVDPAELKLARLHGLLAGGGSLGDLQRLLGSAENIHHGGFLPMSLAVAGAFALLGPGIGSLRLVAALVGALGWWLWVAVLRSVAGPRTTAAGALLLALPPAWALQWGLTPWGSHPEAACWTALWALALARRWSPGATAALVGAGVLWSPLLLPTGLLSLALHGGLRRAPLRAAGGLALGALAIGWPRLLLAGAGLGQSLVEDPALTPLGVFRAAGDPSLLGQTVASHLPLPLVGGLPAAAAGPLDALVLAGCGLAAVGLWRRRGDPALAALRLVALAPVLHLGTVLLASPLRPALHHRYLLPWLPALLLAPLLAADHARRARPLLALSALVAAGGLWGHGLLFAAHDPVARAHWQPWRFQEAGLDRVLPARAPAVVAALDRLGLPAGAPGAASPPPPADPAALAGLAAAFSPRQGYPTLGRPFPPQTVNPRLQGALEAHWQAAPSRSRRAALARGAGQGIWIACDGRAACARDAASRLGRFEEDALQAILALSEP